MAQDEPSLKRTIGLFGATSIGVGAIVGGGILALAGVAFSTTGPSAILAFALNGVIAFLTALTFAEMSSTFPESGGPYLFSKKVMSIRAAFVVGWIVWFASILAAVLYAIGFASFGVIAINRVWMSYAGMPPEWLTSQWMVSLLAIAATSFYTLVLMRSSGGGDQWINVSKIIVFIVLIAGGLWAINTSTTDVLSNKLSPFFAKGAMGLVQAMGFSFIALQGFDLISAVGGEIKKPEHNIPRAMILSLAIALVIYLPLLFVISTVGVKPGETVTQLGTRYPEIIIAIGAKNYLGGFGYWLVIAAGILSMLSALSANLFASSRVAFSMGRDRTLVQDMGIISSRFGTPVKAVSVTSLIVILIILVLPDVATAGAAASLIFLISFALAHWIGILTRKRIGSYKIPFKLPFFPLIPVLGICFAIALAIFQGVVVPLAGLIVMVWLGIGSILYIMLFKRRASIYDAYSEAVDPQLVKLRGRNPLVLVPISNPTNAESMVELANSLVPPTYGRVLLLSVVKLPENWEKGEYPEQLVNSQKVLKEALTASFAEGLSPEALTTVAVDVWEEINRVSKQYHCTSLLVGLTNLSENIEGENLEKLINSVNCDVVVLRVPSRWRFSNIKRVLVPIGGKGMHGELLARLLGTLCRTDSPEIDILKVVPEYMSWEQRKKARDDLFYLAQDLVAGGKFKVKVIASDDVAAEILRQSLESDLLVLGLDRVGKRRAFGHLALDIARNTTCPIVLISHRT